jgi:hypothetical protein
VYLRERGLGSFPPRGLNDVLCARRISDQGLCLDLLLVLWVQLFCAGGFDFGAFPFFLLPISPFCLFGKTSWHGRWRDVKRQCLCVFASSDKPSIKWPDHGYRATVMGIYLFTHFPPFPLPKLYEKGLLGASISISTWNLLTKFCNGVCSVGDVLRNRAGRLWSCRYHGPRSDDHPGYPSQSRILAGFLSSPSGFFAPAPLDLDPNWRFLPAVALFPVHWRFLCLRSLFSDVWSIASYLHSMALYRGVGDTQWTFILFPSFFISVYLYLAAVRNLNITLFPSE